MDGKYLSAKGIFLLFMLIITSCVPLGGLSDTEPVITKTNTPQKQTSTAQPTETVTAIIKEQTSTLEQPTPEETVAQPTERPTPTIRTDLQATDPKSVQIASGEVQLVEFFAFW